MAAAGDAALLQLPPHLVAEIKRGNVVAFVGAGFSAAAGLPRWTTLLRDVTRQAQGEGLLPDASMVEQLVALVERGTGEALNRCAQVLEDVLGSHVLQRMMAALLHTAPPLSAVMQERLALLSHIPFRAILTTNFDLLVPGPTSFDADRPFREVLRPSSDGVSFGRAVFFTTDAVQQTEAAEAAAAPLARGSNEGSGAVAGPAVAGSRAGASAPLHVSSGSSKADNAPGTSNSSAGSSSGSEAHAPSPLPGRVVFRVPIVQLHGSVGEENTVICTRNSYRRLLYGVPGYATFLRSVMASCTLLYVGFSFSDHYLNELRAEVLSMLEADGLDQ
jgi:hypothetical protein